MRRLAPFVLVFSLLLPADLAEGRLLGPERPTGGVLARERREGPLRFAVIGDFGTGEASQRAVAHRMCRWRRWHPYDLVVTTGDNVYDSGQPSRFRAAFFRPYRCLFRHGVRFRATLGNHDVLTRGGRPEVREPRFGMQRRNYVIRRAGVRFVLVNSNRVWPGWLRWALRSSPTVRWTIVVFHHPVFSPGTVHGSTPGFRRMFHRLFKRRGVDLVLNGHDHIYAVTRPLSRIRYVVTGGGGAVLYGCRKRWFSARCAERNHFLIVRAGARQIVVRAVPITGKPFHEFSTTGRP